MKDLRRRVRALEHDAGIESGFLVVLVTGGFDRGESATSGDRQWTPLEGETTAEFRRRVEGEARAAELKFIAFTGLPACESKVSRCAAAFRCSARGRSSALEILWLRGDRKYGVQALIADEAAHAIHRPFLVGTVHIAQVFRHRVGIGARHGNIGE
jgi:hypothetical protein